MVWRQLIKSNVVVSVLVLFAHTSTAQDSFDQQNIEVSLRMIGHRVLLDAGDTTSRVLPIRNENGQYRIEFATEFGVNPDNLVKTVQGVMRETKLTSAYIMQVSDCESDDIVYSFEVKKMFEKDIIPCQSRDLPKSCYALLFTFKQENANVAPTKNQLSNSNGLIFWIAGIVLALVVGISVFIVRRKRKRSIQLEEHVIVLGKFRFDKKKAELILAQQRIELTGKEADLLLLLYNAANTTVERDDILRAVWNDDGDYVGRTLDVFISKLRKKLEADSSIQIVNVRSVGYKLVMD